ncbi:MAG: rhomboid family intramembrane serine protease [Bacteroidia bacterium]|nr:rhomboid family intramembrane serine protease [Bacteroidia bacterium]
MAIFVALATLVFIILIVITSLIGFFQPGFIEKHYFSPYRIKYHGEHYRFLSHAFIHAGFLHLGFNVLALYSFGTVLEEYYFPILYGEKWGRAMFLLLFTGGIYASCLLEYFLYRNKENYASLGISGSVSSVIFAFIIISPLSEIGFFFIPMKGWVAGLLLLALSYIFLRKKRKGEYQDPISHESHYSGAVFGILFMLATRPATVWQFVLTVLESFR